MVYDDSEIAIINIEIDPQSLSWIFDSANLESDSMHVASVHFQNAYINEHIDSIIDFNKKLKLIFYRYFYQ